MKTQVMSLKEFLNDYRERETIETSYDYKDMQVLEEVAKKINKDKRLRNMVAFVGASLLYLKDVFAAENTVDAIAKLNHAGGTILSVMQTIGYWVALIMCIVEILKSLSAGDTRSIGKIIVKYLMAFAGIYVLKWLFDLIKITFGG